jgi:F0F1-type ATP synthase membrane subunit b/b'
MKILDTIADAIWARLKPEVDDWQEMAQKELDEWQVIAQQQLDQWRKDAMAMLSEALPEMAGKIAEQAVLTTFEHTQVDEAANAVSNTIIDIVNRLPRFPFIGRPQ